MRRITSLRIARCAAMVLTGVLVGTGLLSQASAQTVGELRIRARDVTGRGVQVRGALAGPGARTRREVRTEKDGSLTVGDLELGRYVLTLMETGFAAQTVRFEVSSSTPVLRDVTLAVQGVATTVNVSSTPISAQDVPLGDIPIPVQTLTAETMEQTNALDLTDVLKKRLNGVYVSENQNNPFQPDVNYRGYTASPLVGAPAGLSVYVDGVRQNQPFGDVVSWDLIPKVAVAETELIPGSDPLYGLNTLGGAVAVQTKSGLTHGGFRVSGYGGSFGRRAVNGEYGGSNAAGWNWFAGGTLFHEDGWRVQSPSSVKQSFAKLGYVRDGTVVSLSGGYAINNLTGNGTQDFRALNRTVGLNHGYNSVYSSPDTTDQHSPFLTLNATRAVGTSVTLNGNAYVRYARTNTTNGDVNDDSFDQSLYTLSTADKTALTKAGIAFPAVAITAANTPFPFLRCIAQGLQMSEPGEKCTGVDTDTVDRQHGYGFSGLVGWRSGRNRLAAGAGFDGGGLTYVQTAQYGYLNGDGLTVTRIPTYLDGSTQVDGTPQDRRVNLHGVIRTPDFFGTDMFSMGRFVVTAAGRYNHTTVQNTDRLARVAYRGTLTAVNAYQRFNPSAGVVYRAARGVYGYFDYSESSRAPTSTELGCADQNFPCSLPNALVSDPPLKQVVSRTFEFGVRGNPDERLRWSAGYFHTNNNDDLLFVASQQTGYGYFTNFGQTRRQGMETAVSLKGRRGEAGAEYTFLSATYQSTQTINGGSNSSNSNALRGRPGVTDGGTITIVPGNRIPQVPQHLLKLSTDYRAGRRLTVDGDLSLIGSSYVRGDENNLHQATGAYYLGSGKIPGFGMVNLGARYRMGTHYELFAQINNLLNRHYSTAGQLGSTPYDNSGNFTARTFPVYGGSGDDAQYPVRSTTYLSPGAPVTVFGGLKVSFGLR